MRNCNFLKITTQAAGRWGLNLGLILNPGLILNLGLIVMGWSNSIPNPILRNLAPLTQPALSPGLKKVGAVNQSYHSFKPAPIQTAGSTNWRALKGWCWFYGLIGERG